MSRLSNLLRQVETLDAQLGADLKREVEALSGRRAFGLNFERHIPETVELPNRPVRKGDKVRYLPERGAKPSSVDRRIWRVSRIRQTDEGRVADLFRHLHREAEHETASRAVDDLVVVAEFLRSDLPRAGVYRQGGTRRRKAVPLCNQCREFPRTADSALHPRGQRSMRFTSIPLTTPARATGNTTTTTSTAMTSTTTPNGLR